MNDQFFVKEKVPISSIEEKQPITQAFKIYFLKWVLRMYNP